MPSDPLPYDSTRPRRVSVPALLSTIFGIIAIPLDYALCTGSILGLAAIILGIVAVRRINRTGNYSGKPLAIIGIIAGTLSIFLAIGCGIMFFGAFRH